MNKVCQNLQNKLAGIQNKPKFAVEAYETNMSFWGWFMTSSMKAAMHLEPRHNEHFKVSKIQNSKILKVYSLSQRNWYKIEIRNVYCLDSTSPSWTRSTFLSDRAVKWMKAKVHVNSNSVLCLGKIHDPVEAIESWKGQVATFEWRTILSMSYWEWMENQLNSSGKISHDSQHWKFFTKSNAIWRYPTLNRNNSVIESFLCPSSMTKTSTE